MSDTTVINQRALQEIRALQSRSSGDLLAKIINIYLEKSRSLYEDIAESAAAENDEQLGMCAHSLKSSSASVGAMRIFDVCAELEAKAKADDLSNVNELLQSLRDELDKATAELRGYL